MEGARARRAAKGGGGVRRRGGNNNAKERAGEVFSTATQEAGSSRAQRGGTSSNSLQKNIRQALLASSSWQDSVDPGDMTVPRARRTGLRTRPRDVLADPFLKELLRVVSVNTPKERDVAEVLFSLAKMHRSSDGPAATPPPDDHDSTDHSPAVLAHEPSQNPTSGQGYERRRSASRKGREARNPRPNYGSASEITDSEAELWRESFRSGTFRPSHPDVCYGVKGADTTRGKVGARGSKKVRQSSGPHRDPSGDGTAVTSSHKIGEIFAEAGVPVPRAKRSKKTAKKSIPDNSLWSETSEGLGDGKDEGRRSRSSHNAVEVKPVNEQKGPSVQEYMRDILVNVVPPSDVGNHSAPKVANVATNVAERDEAEREGPVPATLKRSFRRNSAHSYIAHFIKWHKHRSKETRNVDWEQGAGAGTRAGVDGPPASGPGEVQTTSGVSLDAARICSAVTIANPPKQTLPVVWPTYLSSAHQESANRKTSPGIAAPLVAPATYNSVLPASVPSYMHVPYLSNGVGPGSSIRVNGNPSVPLGHFSPFPSPLSTVRLQGNQSMAVPNGEVKAVSARGGMGMISGQCVPEPYRQ